MPAQMHPAQYQTIKSGNASKVRFTLEDQVFVVEKLPFDALRGDLRQPNGPDPDWYSLGMARHRRLSEFAENFVAIKALQAWSNHCKNRLHRHEWIVNDFEFQFEYAEDELDDTSFSDLDAVVEDELLEVLHSVCEDVHSEPLTEAMLGIHRGTVSYEELSFQRRRYQSMLTSTLHSHWQHHTHGQQLLASIKIPQD